MNIVTEAMVEAFQAKYREIAKRCNWGQSWPAGDEARELLRASMTGETPSAAKGVTPEMVEAALAEWSKPNDRRDPADIMRAALEAALSVSSGGLAVKVKPLNWKFFDVEHDHGRGDWDANYNYGTFTIHDCGDKFSAENRFYVPHLSAQFATLEAAQSAVFEQYTQRILSAIDRTTLPAAEGEKA